MAIELGARLGVLPTTPAEAEALAESRRKKHTKPIGFMTQGGVWVPAPIEACDCCADLVHINSPKWAWHYYNHCRTRKHVLLLAEKLARLEARRGAATLKKLALELRLSFDDKLDREEKAKARLGQVLGAVDFDAAVDLAERGEPEPAVALTPAPTGEPRRRRTTFHEGEAVAYDATMGAHGLTAVHGARGHAIVVSLDAEGAWVQTPNGDGFGAVPGSDGWLPYYALRHLESAEMRAQVVESIRTYRARRASKTVAESAQYVTDLRAFGHEYDAQEIAGMGEAAS